MLPHPTRGIGFEFLDRLGKWRAWWKIDEQVNMVGGAADGNSSDAEVFRDSIEVCPKIVLQLGGNEVFAPFGAEDAVDKVGGIGVRHSAMLAMMGERGR